MHYLRRSRRCRRQTLAECAAASCINYGPVFRQALLENAYPSFDASFPVVGMDRKGVGALHRAAVEGGKLRDDRRTTITQGNVEKCVVHSSHRSRDPGLVLIKTGSAM